MIELLNVKAPEILSHVPSPVADMLNGFGKPWGICGGAVRDILRGVKPKDIDIMTFENIQSIVDIVRLTNPKAIVKGPYYLFGKSKYVPIADYTPKSALDKVVISFSGVDIWSSVEYGWNEPPKGRIVEFDFTCNAIALWNDKSWSYDDEVVRHILSGEMKIVDSPRARRPHRLAHMEKKGFKLIEGK